MVGDSLQPELGIVQCPGGGGGGVGQGYKCTSQHQCSSCSTNSLEELYLCLMSA